VRIRLLGTLGCLLWLAVAGCETESDRVAAVAREAAERQAEQSKQMAELQSQVAEAHKRLVEGEAKARTELVALQRDLQEAQAEIGRQRDVLEEERRQWAGQRGRDPILAAAITSVGVVLACLLPLLLCIYVVRALRDEATNDAAVAELLVEELAADQPLLLPPPGATPALPCEAGPAPEP